MLTWFTRLLVSISFILWLLFHSLLLRSKLTIASFVRTISASTTNSALLLFWFDYSWGFPTWSHRPLCCLSCGVVVAHYWFVLKIAIALNSSCPSFLVASFCHVLNPVFILSCLVETLHLFLYSSIMDDILTIIAIPLRSSIMVTSNFGSKC